MSDLFGEPPRRPAAPPAQRPPSGRSRALIITASVLAVGFLVLTGLASFWTERLWFDSVGYGSVFSTLLWTRVGLFLVFGALMAAVVGLNMWLAYRFRPVFRPASPEQNSLERYREAVTPIRVWLVVGVSLLMGLFAGTSGAGQWRTYLLWRNGGEFGDSDPYFGRDSGFYMFDLPAWHYVTDFVMALAVVGAMAAAVVHYLYGGLRLQGAGDRLSGAAQVQLSVLVGVFVLAKAVDYWLDRFDVLSDNGGLITGVTFTDENAVLPSKEILAGIAVVCAVLFFVNVWRRTWTLPSVGLALLVLSAILLGAVWPGLVQQFQVNPTEADKEEPYIARNIEATRRAYDIEDVEKTPVTTPEELPDADLARIAIDDPGVRLVDPNIIPAAFEQIQQIRGYYTVAGVLDVDEYDVEGQPRDLVLGVRELDQAGIPTTSQNWANLTTVYTHGDGVIAAYGNQRGPDNDPQSVTGNEEPQWANDPRGDLTDIVGDYESRIYFGEQSPLYSIVGKPSEDAPDLELDLPVTDEGEEATSTYDGQAGVEVGSLFRKLLYAIRFGETNILLSERVHENSKILYHRDPALMVEKVAPWLTVDGDLLPAVVDGRVLWIVDGYTTSDRFPLSEKESFDDMTDDSLNDATGFQTLPTDEINYMRNAVKATVDAYDGTVTLYAWDEEDPILQAWSGAFPGTVRDRDEIPDEVLEHLRYPEDLFKVQRYQLQRYHVTDAGDFYQGNERWEVPVDPNAQASLQPPYRLTLSTEDGGSDFSLTSVFVPVNRQNLAAYMSVNAEADEDGYGEIQLLDLASGPQVQGPGQVASRINADEGLQQALVAFTRGSEARPLYGNLITLPVADRLLYVQPIYTIRELGSGRFPVLQFTAVSFGDEVGYGRTFSAAILDVLGIDAASGTPDPEPGPGEEPGEGQGDGDGQGDGGPVDPAVRVQQLLQQAEAQFAAAERALANNDLGGYQEATDRARRLVDQALTLALQIKQEQAAADEPAEEPAEGSGG